MSYTNQTANYGLPQYTADDKPTYLGDFNKAMLDIDTAIKNADNKADASETLAQNANTVASQALGTAQNAETTATNAALKADNAYATAQSAESTAQSADTKADSATTVANQASATATQADTKATNANTTATQADTKADALASLLEPVVIYEDSNGSITDITFDNPIPTSVKRIKIFGGVNHDDVIAEYHVPSTGLPTDPTQGNRIAGSSLLAASENHLIIDAYRLFINYVKLTVTNVIRYDINGTALTLNTNQSDLGRIYRIEGYKY